MKKRMWTGRILSVAAGLFLLFDASIHIANPSFVQQSAIQLGYNPNIISLLGVIELICVILYIIPRTSVLGAMFLTGYLGGAVATNVRVENPLFSYILAPVYVAIVMWAGLYLRNESLRKIVPIVK